MMAEGSAKLQCLSVLGRCVIHLQSVLQSSEYTRGVLLSHSFTLLAAQAGGLRGDCRISKLARETGLIRAGTLQQEIIEL